MNYNELECWLEKKIDVSNICANGYSLTYFTVSDYNGTLLGCDVLRLHAIWPHEI